MTNWRRFSPALALFLLAPLVGEVVSGSTPFPEYIQPVTWITLSFLYGSGAVIIRELVVRWGRGWLSLILLGAAYAIIEEGLMVQSFFDPTWQDLGQMAVYGRTAGVNWVWAEHLVVFHAVVSIASSVTLIHLLIPDRQTEPWLTRGWWWVNWIGFFAVWLMWETLTTYEPGWWRLVSFITVFGFGWIGRVAPHSGTSTVPFPPKPGRHWLVGTVATLGHFVIVYAAAESGRPAFGWTMAILAIWDVGWAAVVVSWHRFGWHDEDRYALIGGVLSVFLVVGPLASGDPIQSATSAFLGAALLWGARSVHRRTFSGNAITQFGL